MREYPDKPMKLKMHLIHLQSIVAWAPTLHPLSKLTLTYNWTSQEIIAIHRASLGKDQNSKAQVRFILNAYRFISLQMTCVLKEGVHNYRYS